MKYEFPIGTMCKLKPITEGGSKRTQAYVDTTHELFGDPYGDVSMMLAFCNETFMVLGNSKYKAQWSNVVDNVPVTLILHPIHGPVWINTTLIAKI